MSTGDTEAFRVQTGSRVVSYAIDVEAEAGEIYRLVANPHRHHEVDGSQTVGSRAVGPEELTDGARFSVHMRKFGLPYRLPLLVTSAQPPDAESSGVVEWRQPTGHRWRWEVQPRPGGITRVTESFDTSRQNPLVRLLLGALGVPKANARSIQASLRRVRDSFQPGS